MANGNYNHIYSNLVKNDDDILGILAYSLYKRQKIEFIQTFKQKSGNEPTQDDLAPFHDISNAPSQLESYRHQAHYLAQTFLDISLQSQAIKLEARYKAHAQEEIRNSIPGFWFGVGQSTVGAVISVLLFGILVFFTWSLNQGPRHVIQQIFDVQIIANSQSSTPQNVEPVFSPAAP
ncbi:hypothetical protein [Pseudomonas sp.]|uniref:hypothetical protein n=1 Tax=Pseudomonas sp. TaxID=306 RepID=UPI00258B1B1F|nr:hypothetical protein [Pseudomonas sp.]